ncbi:MAG TPA: LPS export ABC transporter periplasmic protein LptC [Gemmatimonadaceae bacterium]|nr:LPS export ABC transporter periplasmic protein LptC [Gemmatimonadaceae bacterium]
MTGFLAVAALACSEKTQPPVAAQSALADSADQVMYGARFNLTDRGLARARLNADTAFFFNENTRVELQKVHTTFFTTTGAKDAVLTARRGTYDSRLGNMRARKNVVVVSEEGKRLVTEELIYDQNRNEISSDSAFVMTEPGRQLSGIGFRSDPNMRNIRILSGASGFDRSAQGNLPSARPAQAAPIPARTESPPASPAAAPPAVPVSSSTPAR